VNHQFPAPSLTTRALAGSWRAIVVRVSVLARRPVLVAFTAALVVRAATAVVIAIGWGGSLFLDDATYSRMAQAAADGSLSSLGFYPEWLYERTGTLLVPTTCNARTGPPCAAGSSL
jgi:hypothetical protein